MTEKKKQEQVADAAPAAPPEEWKAGNLRQRMLWIAGTLPRVAKDSTVSVGRGSFKAVSHDAVVGAIKPLMVQAGVFAEWTVTDHTHELIEIKTKDGTRTAHWHEVALAVKFTNVDNTSEAITGTGYGTGLDTGDKGYGKAVSYGKKYLLLLAFQIETGEDTDQGEHREVAQPRRQQQAQPANGAPIPEPTLNDKPHELAFSITPTAWQYIAGEWHQHGRISDPQKGRLFAIANSNGWESDQVKAVVQHHLGVSVSDIPFGKPYDAVVKAFEKFGPSTEFDTTASAPAGDEGDQDDIPF